MSIIRFESVEYLVGMDASAAKKEITDHGYECRIAKIDNRTLVPDYKPDYDPLRVNLFIKAGIVFKATIG
jgi:hypothetical protein